MLDAPLELDLIGARSAAAPSGKPAPLVVGPENRLLVPPVTELLARGATRFNPLVLVGPAGSGKSHVVQGIVRQLRAGASSPPINALYLTATDFARELVAAVAEDRTPAWRDQLLAADLLAIEDLEGLRPHSPAQLELRSLIDAMLAAGKGTILVTAEREPMAINHLDLGLRDRLTAGLTVRLNRPGVEARRRILQLAASARGWELSDAELSMLARREVGVARQLFGTLLQYIHGRDGAVSESTESSDSEELTASHVAMKQILAATARWFGVAQADILGHSRKTAFVRARNVVVCLARRLTNLSYASIGHALGNRDHTTIMHAETRAAEQAAADPVLQQAIDELDRILR